MSLMVDSVFAGPRPVRGDLDVAWIHGSASRRRRTDPPLQVHAYDEHTYTVVVGTDVASVRQFFGFTDWPAEVVTFELGDRTLEITGVPGHHETSVALYDPWSGLLLTGDTVYPGRLYVQDTPAFTESLQRMLTVDDLRAVRDAAVRVAGSRGIHRFDSFIVWNRPGAAAMARQAVRSLIDRMRRRLPS
jgi:glyoxylase-like metal-dependent hydrolase (beta-lactamase superfamily II)